MRILILDTVYAAFLDSHYARHPELGDGSYDEHWNSLMGASFGTFDAYSHYLGQLGHPAHELIVNAIPLQNAWAAEHGLRRSLVRGHLRTRDWLAAVLDAQVRDFAPDVLYVQDLHAFSADRLRRLRRHARVLAGQIASELPPWEQVEPYDVVFTSFPHFVPRLRERGVDSKYLRIAFDPRILERVDAEGARDGVVFVGALGRGQHDRGNSLLEAVADTIDLRVYGFGLEGWPADAALRRRYGGEAWGLDMYRVLASARIALNRHIDVAEGNANNMRLYEATGMKTLLLTDAKDNLSALFEPGSEVVTYASEQELVERVAYYLEHEEERAEIAACGQRRTLTEHGYDARMRELVALLEARA